MSHPLMNLEEEPLVVTENKTIKRLTLKYYFTSIIEAYNLERGYLFTLKNLLTQPGNMINDYLSTGRFRYVPPFKLLFVTTTLALLVINYTSLGNSFMMGFNEYGEENAQSKGQELLESLYSFFNVILWLFIPMAALLQKWLNRKAVYNYTEHLVFHTFMFSASNFITLVYGLDRVIGEQAAYFLGLILFIAFYLYGYQQFLKKSWLRTVLDNLVIVFFGFVLQAIALALILVIIGLAKKFLGF